MRNLRKDLSGIFIAVILTFLIATLVDARLDMVIFNRNQTLLINYEKINSAIINYDQAKMSFSLYKRNREEKTLEDYKNFSKEVPNNLKELAPIFVQNEKTQMNYRIVSQMLEHRDEVIDSYVNYIPKSETLSKDLEYIQDLSERISSQMNSLMSSYLNQMNEINAENIAWYSRTQFISNGLAFGTLLFLIMIVLYTVKKLKLKIIEATQLVKEIGEENFAVKNMERTRYLDINVYIDTINNMKEKIEKLITQTQEYARKEIHFEQQKRLLAESRMKELQLQINPHFLFNTLSIVIRHIQFGEHETSIKLINETSKILRSSLGKKKPTIPLDDEIELLKSYIYIQQLHLKDRVEINLDIRKAYGREVVNVPPLVVQPLVENAVMHGMRDITKNGQISITILEKIDEVEIAVHDNGKGISHEVIERIKSGNFEGHIGLLNVINRLQILYNRDDVFEIESDEGRGTLIRLHLFKEQLNV